MKKFLSMVLTLAMVLTLIPAVFAAEDATSEPAGITVKYDFTKFEGAALKVDKRGQDYAKTYGFWENRTGEYDRAVTLYDFDRWHIRLHIEQYNR